MSMRFISVVAASVLALPAAAQTPFQGVVTYRMTSEGRSFDVAYMTKGDRVRTEMEMDGMQMFMLMDAGKATMTTVMPDQRMYMTMDLNRMAARSGERNTEVPKITRTGRTETIAGHSCEHYLMGDKQDVDVCVASGLGYYLAGSAPGQRGRSPSFGLPSAGDPRWAEFREMFKDGFFPLKTTLTEGGKVKMEMVATSVEPRALGDDLFTVPAGFQEMRMPGMGPNQP
jgi:hypothetical protein